MIQVYVVIFVWTFSAFQLLTCR